MWGGGGGGIPVPLTLYMQPCHAGSIMLPTVCRAFVVFPFIAFRKIVLMMKQLWQYQKF